MKHLVKYLSVAALLATTVALAKDCKYPDNYYEEDCQNCGTTTFIPRPQGLYSFLTQASFFNPWYYKCCDGTIDSCATYNLGFRYDETWKGERIAECLFGTNDCGQLNFQGSTNPTAQVAGQKYVLADDYGLAPNIFGTVSFKPKIRNYNIDFAGRWELGHCNDCLEGLYFGLAATLTHSSWDLKYCNGTLSNNNDLNLIPALYDYSLVDVDISGYKDIKTALEMNSGFGDVIGQAKYGRFYLDGAQNKTALANIDMILGYDFLRCDGYHLGLFFKTVAPTGNRPDMTTVFSPIVGNAHHWEVGGGLDAHWDIWNCDDQCFSLYLNGAVTTLFKDKQWRTFDLNNCCMSRNALLKVFDITTSGSTKTYTYNQLIRVSDWTTRKIESKFDVMGDASLKFMYRSCGWALGLGYNVYGRSKEKIEQIDDASCFTPQFTQISAVGLKGTTNVDVDSSAVGSAQYVMPGICTSKQIPAVSTSLLATQETLLTDANINFSGAPRQIQHTVFGNIDYQWQDCENQPFAGLGGMCSFAQDGDCKVCTASQWGLWIHGGLTF